jgi:hypothetical protein
MRKSSDELPYVSYAAFLLNYAMLRSRPLLILCALLVPAADALPFNLNPFDLVDPVWDFLAQTTCDTVQSLIRSQGNETFNCNCEGSFSPSKGFVTEIFCALNKAICLNEQLQLYCGTTSFTAEYGLRTGFTKAEACIGIESGLPIDLGSIPQLCIEAIPKRNTMLQFESCSITVDDEKCASCKICANGREVTFDCSNVDLNPLDVGNLPVVPGPTVTECVGIGLVLDISRKVISRSRNVTVLPFGMNPN